MFNEYVSDLIIAIIIYFAGFSKLIMDILSGKKIKSKSKGNCKIKQLFKKAGSSHLNGVKKQSDNGGADK